MPEEEINYAEQLRDMGVQVLPSAWGELHPDQVEEGQTGEGGHYKTVTDPLGHQVTQETTPSGEVCQHVQINL